MFKLNTRYAKYDDCFFKMEKDGKRKRVSIWSQTEGPVMIVNVPSAEKGLKEDEIVVKDYSENVGIVEELDRLGVITETVKSRMVGYEMCYVYNFNEEKALSL